MQDPFKDNNEVITGKLFITAALKAGLKDDDEDVTDALTDNGEL